MPYRLILQEAGNFRRRLLTNENIEAIEALLHHNLQTLHLLTPDPFVGFTEGPGLYLIQARFPFREKEGLAEFGRLWGTIRANGLPDAIPRFYPNRAKQHTSSIMSGQFIPFYLGKEKNVKARLQGHLRSEINSTTYSLKLLERLGLVNGIEFKVGAAPLPVEDEAYFCVGLLEAAIRERLHPIIGRQ